MRQEEKDRRQLAASNVDAHRNIDEQDYVTLMKVIQKRHLKFVFLKFQELEDLKILGEPSIGEPIPPVPFDEEKLNREIRIAFEQCRRLPGEAHIHPVLKTGILSDSTITKFGGYRSCM